MRNSIEGNVDGLVSYIKYEANVCMGREALYRVLSAVVGVCDHNLSEVDVMEVMEDVLEAKEWRL